MCFPVTGLFTSIAQFVLEACRRDEILVNENRPVKILIHLLVVGHRTATPFVKRHMNQLIASFNIPCNFRIALTYAPCSYIRREMIEYEILHYVVQLDHRFHREAEPLLIARPVIPVRRPLVDLR